MRETWEAWEVRLKTAEELDEDRVLVTSTFIARSQQGAPIEELRASVVTVRDGQIVRTENYGSPEKALKAAGLRE